MTVFSKAQLHQLAERAVSSMLDMSRSFDSALNVYSERQFVHEVGMQLRSKKRYWVAFEQRYPQARGDRRRTFADIVAFRRLDRGKTHEYHWFEIKSTGLTHDDRTENAFANLGREKDWRKLRALTNRIWGAHHFGYWLWLYLIPQQSYRDAVYDKFGSNCHWTRRIHPSRLAKVFGGLEAQPLKLGPLLEVLASKSVECNCSLIPRPPASNNTEFSVLLVTTVVKR